MGNEGCADGRASLARVPCPEEMRILTLVTDAFGARGGIAQFGRDLLRALCRYDTESSVVALPRLVYDDIGTLPAGLVFDTHSARGKMSYVRATLSHALGEPFDVIICGHLHVLPLAALIARWQNVPLVLVIYGIEAWTDPGKLFLRAALERVDRVIAISDFTLQRFTRWSGLPGERCSVVPCCVDTARFTPGPKPEYLRERLRIGQRQVILTVARLAGAERSKGIDEMLKALPAIRRELGDVVYVIAGDGADRARLEAKAHALAIRDHVVFAGFVPEREKADLYRLADAFAMPGYGEGFGIVYLEALACGLPVVASAVDASREAVLDGRLGEVVDPGDTAELAAAVIRAARSGAGTASPDIDYFSVSMFTQRWHAVLDGVRREARAVRSS